MLVLQGWSFTILCWSFLMRSGHGYDIFSQVYHPNWSGTLLDSEVNDDIPRIVKRFNRYEMKTRFTGQYNGSMFTSVENKNVEDDESSNLLSYETTTLRTGRRIATFVGVEKDSLLAAHNLYIKSDKINKSKHNKNKRMKRRKKKGKRVRRNVYGRDDRAYIPINQVFGLSEPFIYSVRLSTGCTGITISPRHVLTAAHCIHDQKDYVAETKDMKVGFMKNEKEIEWIAVRNMKVSKGWINGGNKQGPYYDYALLKLAKKHNRPYIRISVSEEDHHGVGERISFSGFDDDKPSGTMWHRSCSIVEDDKTFLYHYCDAKPGSSGSGVYSWIYDEEEGEWVRELVGVFSGNRWRTYDEFYIMSKNFNVAVRLTRSKYAQICKWMGKTAYKVCKNKKQRRRRK